MLLTVLASSKRHPGLIATPAPLSLAGEDIVTAATTSPIATDATDALSANISEATVHRGPVEGLAPVGGSGSS